MLRILRRLETLAALTAHLFPLFHLVPGCPNHAFEPDQKKDSPRLAFPRRLAFVEKRGPSKCWAARNVAGTFLILGAALFSAPPAAASPEFLAAFHRRCASEIEAARAAYMRHYPEFPGDFMQMADQLEMYENYSAEQIQNAIAIQERDKDTRGLGVLDADQIRTSVSMNICALGIAQSMGSEWRAARAAQALKQQQAASREQEEAARRAVEAEVRQLMGEQQLASNNTNRNANDSAPDAGGRNAGQGNGDAPGFLRNDTQPIEKAVVANDASA